MSIDLSNRREVDLSVPILRLPMWVWILSVVLLVLPLVIFGRLHPLHWGDMINLQSVVWIILLVIVHEGVHAIGWKVSSGLDWSQFTFGIDKKSLSPYCHATAPMDIQAYRIGGGAPLVFVGILPFIFALYNGSSMWAFLSAILISAAVGDIYVVWSLRNVPVGSLCVDHPTQAGCIVYLPEGASMPKADMDAQG
jgi:hypothetical protein